MSDGQDQHVVGNRRASWWKFWINTGPTHQQIPDQWHIEQVTFPPLYKHGDDELPCCPDAWVPTAARQTCADTPSKKGFPLSWSVGLDHSLIIWWVSDGVRPWSIRSSDLGSHAPLEVSDGSDSPWRWLFAPHQVSNVSHMTHVATRHWLQATMFSFLKHRHRMWQTVVEASCWSVRTVTALTLVQKQNELVPQCGATFSHDADYLFFWRQILILCTFGM